METRCAMRSSLRRRRLAAQLRRACRTCPTRGGAPAATRRPFSSPGPAVLLVGLLFVPVPGCYSSFGGPPGDGQSSDEVTLDAVDADSGGTEVHACAVDILIVLDIGFRDMEAGTIWIRRGFGPVDARLAQAGVESYHAGVVRGTYDYDGCWLYPGSSPSPFPSGGLLPADRPGPASWANCASPDSPSVRWAVGPSELAAIQVACVALFGVFEGCTQPEPFRAIHLAATPPLVNGWNAGFFRDGALLAVVVYNRWDDCSAADDRLYDVPDGRAYVRRCAAGEYLYDVDWFAAWLRSLRPPGKVLVAVWSGPDGEMTFDEDGYVVSACDRIGHFPAFQSPRFHRLVRAFGEHALWSDICVETFEEFLERVGEFIAAHVPAACGRQE